MATYKYLNLDGTAYLWEKIKNKFATKDDSLAGIQVAGDTITATNRIANIPTVKGASATSAGTAGVVPAPAMGNQGAFLRGDGTWATPTDTKYSGTSPISVSGTVISHANSGVSASTYGTNATTALTPAFGATFSVPGFVVNATGHVTSATSHTVKIPNTAATTAAAGLMSAADKIKLNGIATGAEVNQNAFSNITVGSTTVAADSKTDTLTLVGSGSVSIAANDSNDTITITGTNTTYGVATTAANGLMSSTDKTKLNGIATGATKNAASSSTPLMDGTAAVGTSASYARGDHRHPTDTTRAPLDSPIFTGTPGAPTAAAGTSTTQLATTAFVSTAVANAIGGITGIEYSIVTSLPATGKAGVIYLLSNSGSAPNIYDEYIYVNSKFEKIGTTDVDLSGYVQSSELVAITNAELDVICV